MKIWKRMLTTVMAFALSVVLISTVEAIAVDHSYTVVSGGLSHSLALKSNGSVWAWGSNSSGQLGQDDMEKANKPVEVSGVTGISVAAGYNFSAVLDYTGAVYVWGNGNSEPTAVPSLTGVTAIAAGQTDILALKENGTVWQWTIGSTQDAQMVSKLYEIVAISAGGGHNLALTRTGDVYAWGRNDQGQLGIADESFLDVPAKISSLVNIVDIAAGYSHSLAVDFDGTVYAWGSNDCGQLGNSSATSSSTPTAVKISEQITTVAAGSETSLAMTTTGTIYSWGYGEYGQIGNGKTDISTTSPEKITLSGSTTDMAIAAGVYHNMYVNNLGYIYTWGRNKDGQLGDGDYNNATTPTKTITLAINGKFSISQYKLRELQGLSDWAVADSTALYETEMLSPLMWGYYTQNVTRGEFTHMMVAVYDHVKETNTVSNSTTSFLDISDYYLKQDVINAYRLGLINGKSTTEFAPELGVTREEAAKLLSSLVAKLTKNTISTQVTSLAYYTDANAVSDWAIPYVAYAYEEGIMKGSDNAFKPADYVTREELLVMLSRMASQYGWADI